MRFTVLFILSYFIFLNVGNAQKTKAIPPEKPKLVIGIIIDQMRYDYISRYWDKLEKNGFKRFVNEGAFCKNARQNYIYTQTGPGHATIYTGATPSINGIVSNEWYLRLKKQKVYCVEDSKAKTVGSDSDKGKMSPVNLLTTTIGDELRLSNQNKSKVISISLKDRAAILPGGHNPTAAYWYDNSTGNWITSSYYIDTLPKWVIDFNNKKLSDLYLDRLWTPLLSISEYNESLPDTNKYEKGFGNGQKCFPYDLSFLSKPLKKQRDFSILNITPFGNTFTHDFAIAAIIGENLGKNNFTDFLSVSFSSTDYIGHCFGPLAVETEDAYLRLDKEIAHFIDFIEFEIGKENVLIFLSADHGSSENPQYLLDNRLPGGVFKQYYALSLLKSYLNAVYGEGEWILTYLNQQIFLNHALIEDSKISLSEIQNKVASFLLQFNGVENAVTATTLQNNNFTKGIFMYMQNSFNQKRSGDVLINLEPGWIQDSDYDIDHNTAYSYDTHVPLLWYGWKITRQTILREVHLVDVAPTIAIMLNIEYPSGCCGEPIYELF
ncbi:MAG: alkaline phosphatase family protein [Bacteroidetes bacterium CG23_combo_of_CG06-09_8_20_14_all_32_9]|nr:MAG: alkaline phosphatase family protein [Bacteroidetes bacterium CG23_combo_of_CG06-09_8_20_14_all_32_9]